MTRAKKVEIFIYIKRTNFFISQGNKERNGKMGSNKRIEKVEEIFIINNCTLQLVMSIDSRCIGIFSCRCVIKNSNVRIF